MFRNRKGLFWKNCVFVWTGAKTSHQGLVSPDFVLASNHHLKHLRPFYIFCLWEKSLLLGGLRLNFTSHFYLQTSDFFIMFSFFLLIFTSSRSLEVVVVIRLRELQRVQGRTGWPPGLMSTQTFSSSPQGLWTGQAANRRLRRLPGKLQGELTSSLPGWWMVLVTERCPTKFLGSQLSGGAAVGAGPGKAEEQQKQQVSRTICGCFWIPKINVVIRKCPTFGWYKADHLGVSKLGASSVGEWLRPFWCLWKESLLLQASLYNGGLITSWGKTTEDLLSGDGGSLLSSRKVDRVSMDCGGMAKDEGGAVAMRPGLVLVGQPEKNTNDPWQFIHSDTSD